jgi:acetyltransferase-like isoleucine patch superfamily enzyme
MAGWYQFLAHSDHWAVRTARQGYRTVTRFSVPAPRFIVRPVLAAVVLVRSTYYFLARVFYAEPLFKGYCKSYGRNFHTGTYLHWVQGDGDLIIGDDVTIDGQCNFFFAARYSSRPTLAIGDGTGIGHHCSFVIGERISIGKHCRIAAGIQMFDVSGHPSDPAARLAGKPAAAEDVRPITIGDNVWIGSNAIVYPGVAIGDNSIVSMGSVVMNSVPADTVVAGNPARQIRSLAQNRPGPIG